MVRRSPCMSKPLVPAAWALLLGVLAVVACSPAATKPSPYGVEDDTVEAVDAAADAGPDVATCRANGCLCSAAADCDSGKCKLSGAQGVCVACLPTANPVEVCDGIDNDCDGAVDVGACPDDGPCAPGICSGGACTYLGYDSGPCDDGNQCTAGDQCAAGKCLGGLVNCDDANPCTDDACDPASGCAYLPNAASCTDNNLCTLGDYCANSLCVFASKVACNDKNPCTDDVCLPAKGTCLAFDNTAVCDDGNPCTQNDGCLDGACQAGPNLCPP